MFKKFKGNIESFCKDSSFYFAKDKSILYLLDTIGREYEAFYSDIKCFNKDSSLYLSSDNNKSYLYRWKSKDFINLGFKNLNFNKDSMNIRSIKEVDFEINKIKNRYNGLLGISGTTNYDSTRYLMNDNGYTRIMLDSVYEEIGRIKGEIRGFSKDNTWFWTYDEDSTRLIDWNGKELSQLKGDITGYNRDTSRFWTIDRDSTHLYDRVGKKYGSFKEEVKGFNLDSTLFYIYNNYNTIFYNLDGQLTGVYDGKVHNFKANNKEVVMYVLNNETYRLEIRLLYKNIHEFIKNEVAELSPEEREQYGIDDYLKIDKEGSL